MSINNDFSIRKIILGAIALILLVAGGALYVVHARSTCRAGETATQCASRHGWPTVVDTAPLEGGLQGGTLVTVSGKNFTKNMQVTFGDLPARNVKLISSTKFIAYTPPSAVPGAAFVTVSLKGQSNTLPASFRYAGTVGVRKVEPAVGPAGTTTDVTIYGSGFAKDSVILFGGTQVKNLVFIDTNTVKAQAPAHAPGVVDVDNITGDEDAVLPDGFTYQ